MQITVVSATPSKRLVSIRLIAEGIWMGVCLPIRSRTWSPPPLCVAKSASGT